MGVSLSQFIHTSSIKIIFVEQDGAKYKIKFLPCVSIQSFLTVMEYHMLKPNHTLDQNPTCASKGMALKSYNYSVLTM